MNEHKRAQKLDPFDITTCAGAVRALGKSSNNQEQLAQSLSQLLFENLMAKPGNERACVLVRFFRTLSFHRLTAQLKERVLVDHPEAGNDAKFLTLLGTAGSESAWSRRQLSEGHQVIPLLSPEMISQSPMIARLVQQLGIEISVLLKASSNQLNFENPTDRDYNIFYVEDAQNSPFIPSQSSFVKPYGVRSVVGYGSLLDDGDFYAVLMFFKVKLPEQILKQFTALALSTTIGVLSVPPGEIFTAD